MILIHTSVKLVTITSVSPCLLTANFNPHEREARDAADNKYLCVSINFNPHEREARDPCAARRRAAGRYFNPHEREARDSSANA